MIVLLIMWWIKFFHQTEDEWEIVLCDDSYVTQAVVFQPVPITVKATRDDLSRWKQEKLKRDFIAWKDNNTQLFG